MSIVSIAVVDDHRVVADCIHVLENRVVRDQPVFPVRIYSQIAERARIGAAPGRHDRRILVIRMDQVPPWRPEMVKRHVPDYLVLRRQLTEYSRMWFLD